MGKWFWVGFGIRTVWSLKSAASCRVTPISATAPHPCAAFRLVEEHPDRAVAWFAVGCYYMCAQQYEQARRYFGKVCMAAGWAGRWWKAFALLRKTQHRVFR